MKAAVTALLLTMLPALGRATDMTGAWLSCDPKVPWTYALLSVDREGESYRWTAEWGSPYAAAGDAHLRDGELVLRGCNSYRGKTVAGCSEERPPVFARLRRQDFERTRSYFTQEDLRHGKWVRVVKGTSWQALAQECERVVEKMRGRQEDANK